jgi:hypothetical protein
MNGHVLSYIATLPCLYVSPGWFEVFIILVLDLGTKIELDKVYMNLDLTLKLNPMSLHKPKLGIKLGLVGFKGFFFGVRSKSWSEVGIKV